MFVKSVRYYYFVVMKKELLIFLCLSLCIIVYSCQSETTEEQENGAYVRQTDQYELSITREAYDEEKSGFGMGDTYWEFNNHEISDVIEMLKSDEKALVYLQDFPEEKNYVTFTYSVTDNSIAAIDTLFWHLAEVFELNYQLADTSVVGLSLVPVKPELLAQHPYRGVPGDTLGGYYSRRTDEAWKIYGTTLPVLGQSLQEYLGLTVIAPEDTTTYTLLFDQPTPESVKEKLETEYGIELRDTTVVVKYHRFTRK